MSGKSAGLLQVVVSTIRQESIVIKLLDLTRFEAIGYHGLNVWVH